MPHDLLIISFFRDAMKNSLLELIFTGLAIIYTLGAPATFIYLVATTEHWTLLNAVPLVLLYLIQSSLWLFFWPIHLIF